MVEIISYQERWPQEFQEIAHNLRTGLGSLAIRIDHIGSTSVPDLAAKDIIDIQITVKNFTEEFNSAMEQMGYKRPEGKFSDHCPPTVEFIESDWEKWFFFPPSVQRRAHIHVRKIGNTNQRYPLLFRDYLRAHPASAGAYAELKRRLAANLKDLDLYPEVKDPAVDLIYFAAEEWAERIHWNPGRPDA